MGLRVWGIALIGIGFLTILAGAGGAYQGHRLWEQADERCAGSTDTMCGAGATLGAAFLMGLSPLAAIPGAILIVAGAGILAIRRFARAATGAAFRSLW